MKDDEEKVNSNLRDRFSNAEFENLHILIGVMHHAGVSGPCQPRWYSCRQVTTQKLSGQGVQGASGYAHLKIQTTGANEKSDALRNQTKKKWRNEMIEETVRELLTRIRRLIKYQSDRSYFS